TAAYDRAISAYFAGRSGAEGLPDRFELSLEKKAALRYGENPHQKAAFYVEPAPPPASVASAAVLHGQGLAFNNYLDRHSALGLVREQGEPAVAVIKHNNPCGCAIGATLEEAFRKAYEGDPLSAYGGVVGLNRVVDKATAMQLTEPGRFLECVIAPGFTPE